MTPQTETKTRTGFKAGVKDYRLTYYTPEYLERTTDILAAFRITPQPGVPAEEAGAAVAAESSTGTWTTVWTDGLTCLDRYKGRCYDIEPVEKYGYQTNSKTPNNSSNQPQWNATCSTSICH